MPQHHDRATTTTTTTTIDRSIRRWQQTARSDAHATRRRCVNNIGYGVFSFFLFGCSIFFFHNALVCLRFFLLLLFQAWRRCESNAHFRATLTKLQKNKNDCCSHHSLSLPRPPISFLYYYYANISAVTCGHAWLSRARSVAAQCDAD